MFNYEQEIENQLVERLELNNSAFEVNRFYESAGAESLASFILDKVRSIPSVFVRCTGLNLTQVDTMGDLSIGVYTIDIIVATNDAGRIRQLKGENRKCNDLALSVLSRLNGWGVDLSNQPAQSIVFTGVRDLFTVENIDARVLSFEVQGVVIDLDNV